MMFFISIALLLMQLWGVGWFSSLFIVAYSVCCIFLFFTLKPKPFQCLLSDNGFIEIDRPKPFVGNISGRSFYNVWVVFLCVEEHDPLLINERTQYNKRNRWFIVFNDSVDEQYYRLIARLIVSARG